LATPDSSGNLDTGGGMAVDLYSTTGERFNLRGDDALSYMRESKITLPANMNTSGTSRNASLFDIATADNSTLGSNGKWVPNLDKSRRHDVPGNLYFIAENHSLKAAFDKLFLGEESFKYAGKPQGKLEK